MRILIFILLCSSVFGSAEELPVISSDQFKPGAFWTWAYSEQNSKTEEILKPYLYETYRVVKRQGDEVTIEMSSSPHPTGHTKAHHLFIANVATCSTHRMMRPKRTWFIRFYTRSLGNHQQWELVSDQYDGSAFEEKFNCISQGTKEEVERRSEDFKDQSLVAFHLKSAPHSSWYFEQSGVLTAVAASKEFDGKIKYHFQLFDFSSSSPQRSNF